MRRSLFTLLLLLVLGLPLAALAQMEGPGCDPDFLESMNKAAWMSGQRELEAAETLILKPDSVLQYSCFDETFREVPYKLMGPDIIIDEILPDYIGTNFSKDILSEGELCVSMAEIWQKVKCTDFNKDNFRTFGELAGFDPRVPYDPCESDARNEAWAIALDEAFPEPDETLTYWDWIFSGDCEAAPPVLTGVMAYDDQGGEYEDLVCMVPGCFNAGGGACE